MPIERFALLDDCEASPAEPLSRLYLEDAGEIRCDAPDELAGACSALDAALAAGLHAVVLADYEWGVALQRYRGKAAEGQTSAATLTTGPRSDLAREDAPVLESAESANGSPAPGAALRFLLFRRLERLSSAAVERWLAGCELGGRDERGIASRAAPLDGREENVALPGAGVAGIAALNHSVTRAQFDYAMARIREALQRGDTYQVNYTFRLAFDVFGSPFALYRRLRARQPARYGALIFSGGQWILSCSPELFIRHEAGRLRAEPMKGTAARHAEPERDRRCRAALAADEKNRAENLMIVDLLRNDISRVARLGTVDVEALFATQALPTLWQMTSQVNAELRDEATFTDVLRALFPCGSITGAPKHHTMALIESLETTPRGLYTGALGWIERTDIGTEEADCAKKTRRACPDFCLSVAIRTATIQDRGNALGCRSGRLGIGAGIVFDSRVDEEYEECLLKGKFLSGMNPGFALIETMRVEAGAGCAHLERHLARLADSAAHFGFDCDLEAIRERIASALAAGEDEAGQPPVGTRRLRLALSQRGQTELSLTALPPLADGPLELVLAGELGFADVDPCELLLRHKTSARERYDQACRHAVEKGAFDALFFNTRGELTEGARSNVFLELDGKWYTPPVSCGLLPGVMRAVVLEDPRYRAREHVLTRDDLRAARRIAVCNGLRGLREARLRA